jgi:hypothetical protein
MTMPYYYMVYMHKNNLQCKPLCTANVMSPSTTSLCILFICVPIMHDALSGFTFTHFHTETANNYCCQCFLVAKDNYIKLLLLLAYTSSHCPVALAIFSKNLQTESIHHNSNYRSSFLAIFAIITFHNSYYYS